MPVHTSILVASVRPGNIAGLLENLRDTVKKPDTVEVLVKLKEGDAATIAAVEKAAKEVPFAVRYVASAERDGYYSLNEGYDELVSIAAPETYFFWLLNDEVRIATKGWDVAIGRYVGFFPDDVFRLRLSVFKLKNYYSVYECFPCPDNYALTTKKWLELTDGWGDFWGGDSWHQAVEYYLGAVRGGYGRAGYHRGVPVFDVELENEEAGQGVSGAALRHREDRIAHGWQACYTRRSRERLNRLAQRLYCHIAATEQGILDYQLEEDPLRRTVTLLDGDANAVLRCSYRLGVARHLWRLGVRRFPVVTNWWGHLLVSLYEKSKPVRPAGRKVIRGGRAIANSLISVYYRLTVRMRARHVYRYSGGHFSHLSEDGAGDQLRSDRASEAMRNAQD